MSEMRERIARAIYEETSRQVSAEKADLGKVADAVLAALADPDEQQLFFGHQAARKADGAAYGVPVFIVRAIWKAMIGATR